MNEIHCYELLQDLPPRGSAEAVLLRFHDGRYIRTQNRIVVHDFVDTHGDRGDRGYAFESAQSGKWEALSGLFQQAPSWSVL